jgi:hypothetical protein
MSDSIKFAQGAQTVRCVPVDEMAIVRRVTSATYRSADRREGDGTSRRAVVASTAATAPTVSTTLGAAAGPSTVNPRRVTVASLSGIRVGGVYLITAAGASDEAVTVTRIYTATLELELSRALTRPFASGVAFQGVELEGSFPSDVAADEMRLDNGGGPFQVTWIYTIGSVQYVVPRELWLTRYGMAPWVRFDECEPHLPGLAQSIGDAVDPASAIRGATDDALAHLLETTSERRDPAYFRGNLSLDLAIRKRAIYYCLLGSRGGPLIDLADRYATEASQHLHNLTEGKPPHRTAYVDPVTDTSAAGGEKVSAGGILARS